MTQRRSHLVSRLLLSSSLLFVTHSADAQLFDGDGPPVVMPKIDLSLGGMTNSAAAPGASRIDANARPSIHGTSGDDKNGLSSASPPAQPPAGAPLKPLPPNDFQKFVSESTGQDLPLFGANFFQQAASTYQPLANTPVSPDYTLGPGDEVLVRGWGAVDIDVKAVVDRNGLIHIPRVGAVALGGVKSSQATGVIQTAISRYFKDFQLSVTLGQLRGITVYVVGQARKPGAYTLSSMSTLVSALFACGGPGANGSMRHVQVKRGDKLVSELDLYDFLSKGDKSTDIKLLDGDTIIIPAAQGYVALVGKVNTPAVYEIDRGGDTIESLLAVAGGLPVVADPKRATLERISPERKPARSVESFALDGAGLKRPLRSGDMLSVASLAPEFGNAVTLRGNVDQPVRLPWTPGMRIRDLIPTKGGLLTRASLRRQNETLLSQDERKSAAAALEGASSSRPTGVTSRTDNSDNLAQRIGDLVDEINLDYAVVERVDRQNVSVKLIPFALGKAMEDERSADNIQLEAGDVVTVFSVDDIRVPVAKRRVVVRVEGEVARPGVYQVRSGDTLQQLIQMAGGLTPDAYLFGTEFYREEVRRIQLQNLDLLARRLEAQMQTRLINSAASVSSSADTTGATAQLRFQAEAQAQRQALDRLKSIKPSGRIMLGLPPSNPRLANLPGLRLESRDRVVVPAKPEFVHVLGAVNTESALIWQEGTSVQRYLEQSGLTSGADVSELFIIRADGSVISGNAGWFNRITSEVVQPGDLIVLPEKADHESAWSVFTRNAKDITQIVYQLSLGAAAIKTLRN